LIQCAASLEGGWDGYLSRRTEHERKNLRREGRLVRKSGIEFERVSPEAGENALKTFDRMLAVEWKSWKGLQCCGMQMPPSKNFYRLLLARMAASRSARVIFARHDGADIGYIYGSMAGKIYRGQQFSFDDAWRKYSVGDILQAEQIQWLCEEGAARYDMGPYDPNVKAYQYKKHWTEQFIQHQIWVMRRR
jgi:CelD/BcsL family acetyltransferase involved in cellulose biosynthesis